MGVGVGVDVVVGVGVGEDEGVGVGFGVNWIFLLTAVFVTVMLPEDGFAVNPLTASTVKL